VGTSTGPVPTAQPEPRKGAKSLWPLALIVLIPGLLLGGIFLSLRSWGTSIAKSHEFHSYGVVHTRLGDATVGCGGDLTFACNGDVGIQFDHQTPELLAYFTAGKHVLDQTYFDHLVRGLAGNPPAGTRWTVFACPGARWDVVLHLF
jgi:hypothetical protein